MASACNSIVVGPSEKTGGERYGRSRYETQSTKTPIFSVPIAGRTIGGGDRHYCSRDSLSNAASKVLFTLEELQNPAAKADFTKSPLKARQKRS